MNLAFPRLSSALKRALNLRVFTSLCLALLAHDRRSGNSHWRLAERLLDFYLADSHHAVGAR